MSRSRLVRNRYTPEGRNTRKTSRSASKKAGQLRIIAGQWRGRRLPVADVEGLRPTTDQVRETLFNWLQPWLANASCLDCYSGSGALSFEALSRGAGSATLLELASPAVIQLKQNLTTLGAENAQVITTDTLRWLQQPAAEPFDLVFLDPPFRKDLLEQTCQLLEQNSYLSDDALIYVETEKELGLPNVPASWEMIREKKAGQLCYRLYHRNIEPEVEAVAEEGQP